MDHSIRGIGQGVGIAEHKFSTLLLIIFQTKSFPSTSKRVDYELFLKYLGFISLMASARWSFIPVERPRFRL